MRLRQFHITAIPEANAPEISEIEYVGHLINSEGKLYSSGDRSLRNH